MSLGKREIYCETPSKAARQGIPLCCRHLLSFPIQASQEEPDHKLASITVISIKFMKYLKYHQPTGKMPLLPCHMMTIERKREKKKIDRKKESRKRKKGRIKKKERKRDKNHNLIWKVIGMRY